MTKTTMEHNIRKMVPVNSFFVHDEKSASETPMIIREMMIYNRQLVEENFVLASQVKNLELEIQRLHNQFELTNLSPNHPKETETFEVERITNAPELSYLKTPYPPLEHAIKQKNQNEDSPVQHEVSSLKKKQKRGTQIYIDPAIATMFSRQLKDSGYKLAEVCRAMMLIAIDRPRYRNMIFDRVKTSERLSNSDRDSVSFAFTYPKELGEVFMALIRSNKIRQFEFFEQMFKEFVQSYSFRKLLPEYIYKIKTK